MGKNLDVYGVRDFYDDLGTAVSIVNKLVSLVEENSRYMTAIADTNYEVGVDWLRRYESKRTADLANLAADNFMKAYKRYINNIPTNRVARISRVWGPLITSANDTRRNMYERAARSASLAAVCLAYGDHRRDSREWAEKAQDAFENYAEAEETYHFTDRAVPASFGDMALEPDVSDVRERISKERRKMQKALSAIN
jgi:hypothetical protein